jgi:hypothetical protein
VPGFFYLPVCAQLRERFRAGRTIYAPPPFPNSRTPAGTTDSCHRSPQPLSTSPRTTPARTLGIVPRFTHLRFAPQVVQLQDDLRVSGRRHSHPQVHIRCEHAPHLSHGRSIGDRYRFFNEDGFLPTSRYDYLSTRRVIIGFTRFISPGSRLPGRPRHPFGRCYVSARERAKAHGRQRFTRVTPVTPFRDIYHRLSLP